MEAYEIRRMTVEDLDTVYGIEADTFPRPWSREDFRREIEENKAARYLVITVAGRVIGYAGAWIVLDECQVTNIAIAEPWRGQGYGHALTAELLQYLSNYGAAYVTLEVRVSNLPAQALYKRLGFITVGKRKRYYEDNGEDAFLMLCEHLPDPDPDFVDIDTVYEEES